MASDDKTTSGTTMKVFSDALDELSLLRFFPSEPGVRAALLRILCQMVAGPAELRWLVDTVLTYYDEWPGPRELRAVYCTRFRPRDGAEADLTSGRLAQAIEQKVIEQHDRIKALPISNEARQLLPALRPLPAARRRPS